jgi:hypothetical protein
VLLSIDSRLILPYNFDGNRELQELLYAKPRTDFTALSDYPAPVRITSTG